MHREVFVAPGIHTNNVYALQFSPDGRRLAVGSGGWYGGGGVTLLDIESSRFSALMFADCEGTDHVEAPWARGGQALTVSGVCFDGSGRHLALTSWSTRHHAGPTFVCKVDGLALEHVATFETPSEGIGDRCPTGVAFLGGQVVVRCNARRPQDVFVTHHAPDGVDAGRPQATNAHSRLAAVGAQVVTGGGGSLEPGKATNGLIVGPAPVRLVTGVDSRVTAVIATADAGLLTGGLDGSIHRWSLHEGSLQVDGIVRQGAPRESSLRTAWATYRPESVVGLCRLGADRWFSVDADGEVWEWNHDTRTKHHALPRPGTPRAIAVHPSSPFGPLLAVGVKGADDEPRTGYVAFFDL